jgi:hypothetical protein
VNVVHLPPKHRMSSSTADWWLSHVPLYFFQAAQLRQWRALKPQLCLPNPEK